MGNYKKPSVSEISYAKKVCWFILFAFCFAGWIETREPAPQPNSEQTAMTYDQAMLR